jgi:predicted nucleic acid-binding protein
LEAIDEVRRKVREKLDLSKRITSNDVESLIDNLMVVAIVAPRLVGPVSSVVRDPKDDYLVAQAVRVSVDVVVTGDKDLLALRVHRGVRFTAPAAFALELML